MSLIGKITRIKKRSTGDEYSLAGIGFPEALEQAELKAQQADEAAAASTAIWAQNVHLTGLDNIPVFDSGKNYNQYDLVLYKLPTDHYPHVYRCLQTHSAREWNNDDWADTSVWGEIERFNIGVNQYETVKLQLIIDSNGVLSTSTGVTNVYVTANGVTTTYQTSADGYVEFNIQRNQTYTISVADITGYYTPTTQTRFANSSIRTIRMIYYAHRTGWYVIWEDSNNNMQETYATDWDTANNSLAKAVKFYCSLGHFAILKDSPWRGSGSSYGGALQWCVQNYQFDVNLLPNYGTAAAAGGDWKTVENTNNIIALADDPTNGYGIVNNWSMNNELFTYVPAAKWCRNQNITIGGSTYYGSLPSAGMLNIFATASNLTDLHSYLTMIGSTYLPPLRSGNWWSSSQYSQPYAWGLNLGSLNYTYNMRNAFQILPFFDF